MRILLKELTSPRMRVIGRLELDWMATSSGSIERGMASSDVMSRDRDIDGESSRLLLRASQQDMGIGVDTAVGLALQRPKANKEL